MNSRVLAELAFKVWGVILLVGTLRATPSIIFMAWWTPTSDPSVRLALPLNFTLSILFAGFLITCGGPVARRIIPDSGPLHLGIDYSQLQALGFALVGLVTLVSGLE